MTDYTPRLTNYIETHEIRVVRFNLSSILRILKDPVLTMSLKGYL